MDKVNKYDEELVNELDEKLIIAREKEYETKLHMAKKTKIFEIEDKIKAVKDTADRYKNLKFV